MKQAKDIKAIGGIGASGHDVRKVLVAKQLAEHAKARSSRTARSVERAKEISWRNDFIAPTSEDE